jgi:hypothetical protein
MNRTIPCMGRLRALSALVATTSLLAACGGSSDDAAPPPPAAGQINGTAAVGAALANAQVAVTDSAKTSVCSQATIVTTGVGSFTCTVLAGKTAPFLVVVTDPSGAYAPMVSIVGSTPASGSTLVVNATPLTTAIVSQLAPNGDALALVADPTLMNLATFNAVRTNVLAQLGPTLTALGAPAGYDPFSTPITAATGTQAGNTADQVIETLRFSNVNGVTTVATIDNPAGAVALAGATTTDPSPLPAPSVTVVSLSEGMRLLAKSLSDCFALPVAQRVLATDTSIPLAQGGPAVTDVGAACDDTVHQNYLHNGFSGGQAFYGLLRDATMVGAVFNPPEVMRFIDDTTAADADRAVLNQRFTDANGVAGNFITVAQKFPGSATTAHPTDWWLYGNQQPVDSSIQAFVRRSEQQAPNPGTAPFANASASRYETGLNIFINKDGPGSTGLRAARVMGPGLPPAGVVMTPLDPNVCSEQNWMNIRRKDGLTDTASATFAGDVGNIFRLQRTVGLTGADATSVRPNPNAGNNNTTAFPNWAHPLDYGAAVGATNYIDFSQLSANITYSFELFYDGETTARHTLTKTLLTPVIPSTRGGNLQWLALTPGTLGYLDPANALGAAQTSMNLAWTANPYAETIRSAGVYTFGGATVNQGQVGVARGATSALANAPGAGGCAGGTSFPALTADGITSRAIQLRYRMLDGSYKDSFSRWN